MPWFRFPLAKVHNYTSRNWNLRQARSQHRQVWEKGWHTGDTVIAKRWSETLLTWTTGFAQCVTVYSFSLHVRVKPNLVSRNLLEFETTSGPHYEFQAQRFLKSTENILRTDDVLLSCCLNMPKKSWIWIEFSWISIKYIIHKLWNLINLTINE